MLMPLPWWPRLALAARIVLGLAAVVRHPDDRWHDGCRVRRIEVLRISKR